MRRWLAGVGLTLLLLVAPGVSLAQTGAAKLLTHPGTRRLISVLEATPSGGLALHSSLEAIIARNKLRTDEDIQALLAGIDEGVIAMPDALHADHPRLASLLVQVAVGQPARWQVVEQAASGEVSAKERLTGRCEGPTPAWVNVLREAAARGIEGQSFATARSGPVRGGEYIQYGLFQRYHANGRLENEAELAERLHGEPFGGTLTWRVKNRYEQPGLASGPTMELLEVEVEAIAETGEVLYLDTVRMMATGQGSFYSTGDFEADQVSGAHTFNVKVDFDPRGRLTSGFFEVGIHEIIENFQPTLRFLPEAANP